MIDRDPSLPPGATDPDKDEARVRFFDSFPDTAIADYIEAACGIRPTKSALDDLANSLAEDVE